MIENIREYLSDAVDSFEFQGLRATAPKMSESIPSLLKRLEQDHLFKGLSEEQEKNLIAQVGPECDVVCVRRN